MKKVKITYRDICIPDEEWTTKEYDPKFADEVMENLRRMGCVNVRKIPA